MTTLRVGVGAGWDVGGDGRWRGVAHKVPAIVTVALGMGNATICTCAVVVVVGRVLPSGGGGAGGDGDGFFAVLGVFEGGGWTMYEKCILVMLLRDGWLGEGLSCCCGVCKEEDGDCG